MYYFNAITLTNGINVHTWIFLTLTLFFHLLSQACYHEWLHSDESRSIFVLPHLLGVMSLGGRGKRWDWRAKWRQIAGNKKQPAKNIESSDPGPSKCPTWGGETECQSLRVALPSLYRHTRPLDGSMCCSLVRKQRQVTTSCYSGNPKSTLRTREHVKMFLKIQLFFILIGSSGMRNH